MIKINNNYNVKLLNIMSTIILYLPKGHTIIFFTNIKGEKIVCRAIIKQNETLVFYAIKKFEKISEYILYIIIYLIKNIIYLYVP